MLRNLPPVPRTLSKSKLDMSTRSAPDKLTVNKNKQSQTDNR